MALEVNIKKQCNRFELEVEFAHDKGILGVLGASGCGKSMTLKCIAGIETPDEGRIVLDGRVLFDSGEKINLPPQQRHVGYLFQNYALFPHMTVEQNILAGVKSPSGQQRADVLNKYLKLFYLEDLRNAYPKNLSGGQQQRTALARIFASEPDILMLDEPFSALDDYLKWQVELQLAKVLELYAGSILFVSHSRDEIYRFCEDIIVLSKGRIAACTTKHELFESPQSLAASKLSGCKNHSPVEFLGSGVVNAIDWGIQLKLPPDFQQPDDAAVKHYVGIRAHDIKLIAENEKERDNIFDLKVEAVIENLFSTIVMLRHEGASSPLRLEIGKDDWRSGRNIGDTVRVQLPKQHLFLVKE